MATRRDIGIAAVCATWAAAFLAGEGAALALAPLFGLAALPARRHPLAATLAVAGVTVATFVSGVSEESPASLAAGLYVVYTLGRHGGYAPVLVLTVALTAVGGAAVADVLFVLFILTATWACGRLVRRRTERAHHAAAVVAEERARLAGDALDVIRRAVERMRDHARAAAPELARGPLLAIQDEGRAAVAELRRLLGLLRAEPEEPAPPEPRRRGPRAHLVLVAAGLMALALVDVAAWHAGVQPGAIALTLAMAAAVALVPFDAGVACLAAAVPSVLAAALDAPIAYGFSTALACGVLAWSAGADGRPRTLAALAALVVTTLVVVRIDSPGNEGVLLGAFALTGVTGQAYGRRDREGAAALATAGRLRREHEAAAERAVRAERLRLARELHDVASHAVGAMVLQAGAALALRDRDPDGARAALRTVETAGTEAISELAVLFGLLDAAGLASSHDDRDLAAALAALADRMRGGGLDVLVRTPSALPDDPVLVATAFRIVQEALTNAARHAPGSRVTVTLESGDDRLVVTVADDGGTPGGALEGGGGFGLVGLAERVRALGGDLAAGPAPSGGFTVSARLPMPTGAVA